MVAPVTLARVVLSAMFDDASLFPPAAAPMEAALGLHHVTGASPWGFARGRFLVPLGALADVVQERRLLGLEHLPLRLGVIIGSPADPTAASPLASLVDVARAAVKRDPLLHIEHVEYRDGDQTTTGVATTAERLGLVADELDLVAAHVELVSTDPAAMTELVATLAAARATDPRLHAKLRFGGLTADLFPGDDVVVAFLAACSGASVPFKGTAGLHHAWYQGGDNPHHGYLAVLLAVVAIHQGKDRAAVLAELLRGGPDGVTVGGDAINTPSLRATITDLDVARRTFVSFGTCSFTEPLAAFQGLRPVHDQPNA